VQLLEEDLGRAPAPTHETTTTRLEIIHGELHRLENIVKHFLRLARPTDLDPGPVDLGKLVKHVCDLLRPEADAQATNLAMRIQEPLPELLADASQLTQALVNLVINALQAVQRCGQVVVSATVSEPPQEVAIEVRDTGPGIAHDRFSAIFDPYYTTKEEGSGLGLWIAQQITTAHRGSLRAANDPEGGAVFTLRLPVCSNAAHRG
jgi:signal transduction histidine kinase